MKRVQVLDALLRREQELRLSAAAQQAVSSPYFGSVTVTAPRTTTPRCCLALCLKGQRRSRLHHPLLAPPLHNVAHLRFGPPVLTSARPISHIGSKASPSGVEAPRPLTEHQARPDSESRHTSRTRRCRAQRYHTDGGICLAREI